MYVFICYLEEGAEREPVGGGRRWKSYYVYEYNIYIYITWRKGPSENRQEGEDGDNYIYFYYVLKYDSDKLY